MPVVKSSINMSRFLVMLSLFIGAVFSCSMPHGWKVKTIAERAKNAEIIIYGKVIDSPLEWHLSARKYLPVLNKNQGLYWVNVEVYCTFKGPEMARLVNITNFGYLPGYCVENHAVQDEKGIFFVTYGDSGELSAQKVNMQKSIVPATEKNLLEIIKATRMLEKKNRDSMQKSGRRNKCPVIGLYTS